MLLYYTFSEMQTRMWWELCEKLYTYCICIYLEFTLCTNIFNTKYLIIKLYIIELIPLKNVSSSSCCINYRLFEVQQNTLLLKLELEITKIYVKHSEVYYLPYTLITVTEIFTFKVFTKYFLYRLWFKVP